MKLIVGLGNPGRKFVKTRHNTGHLFISKISAKGGSTSRGKSQKAKIRDQVKLCKTTVFMNNSGEEVKKLTITYNLSPNDLLIVHDDMDLPLGKFKLQFGRSAAGHKGVQSVIDALGTQDFWRLRIGIGKPPEEVAGEEYVLQPFRKEELVKIKETFPKLEEVVRRWIEKS